MNFEEVAGTVDDAAGSTDLLLEKFSVFRAVQLDSAKISTIAGIKVLTITSFFLGLIHGAFPKCCLPAGNISLLSNIRGEACKNIGNCAKKSTSH
jgi:hypothetical protein